MVSSVGCLPERGRPGAWIPPSCQTGRVLSAVCFDLMDTVLYDPYREALRAATGLEPAELAGVKDPTCWPSFELGEIDEAEFAERFFTAPGQRLDLVAFNDARRAHYRFLPGVERLLGLLQGRVDLHLASNYPVWIDELIERFDLATRFDGVWASHELGVRKPDPQFFERLLDKVGHPAQRCLFVDDRKINCRAAAEAGFAVHHFTGVEALESALRADGVLP
jgi:FMN hydrolase / 5-amino-6-(5-phospho-D-ribitylamino)uracil phosphatase